MKRLLVMGALVAFLLLIYQPLLKWDGSTVAASVPELSEQKTRAQTAVQLASAMADFRALPRPEKCRDQAVLIVYDTVGDWGHLGELYAVFTANLVGRWADFDAMPVSEYRRGGIESHALTVYVGTSFEEEIPRAFAADLAATERPVLWMQYGLENVVDRFADFGSRYGFVPRGYDGRSFSSVDYKGVRFTRAVLPDGAEPGELAKLKILDEDKVRVLAVANRTDGVRVPWAVRAGNLTYVADNPFTSADETDRYLVFADILTGLLAPNAPERHRALLRIEDVGPAADPAALRELADYLRSRGVPFSVAVYDTYVDPLAPRMSAGRRITLAEADEVVEALQYMVEKGGTLIMHGHTHQLGAMRNPYDGRSASDFEFFRAHVDQGNNVVMDGPDARDSRRWALARFDSAHASWQAAGLPRPTIFEFPHYAASALDYAAAGRKFAARYEHSQYYTGTLRPIGPKQVFFEEQFFPYPVRDVYGQVVLPENMGNYTPRSVNQHEKRLPEQLLAAARRNWVMQDGFASFFHHWYLGVDQLKRTVEPMQAQGWRFVSPQSVVAEVSCRKRAFAGVRQR